ncbi:hypothetical protein ACGFX4_09340 [Kitasatospora sp. NPDC048365]|uniref:hypothetical protein n=1 Tax=Kitasatospora sp. NPDC048365 TaxID=3364050 RepID=UPI003712EDB8
MLEIAMWFAVLLGVTVVSIGSVSPVELVVAGIAALGGALVARRMRRVAGVQVAGARGAGRAVLALPAAVGRGTAVLVKAVVRPSGRAAVVREVRLAPGADAGWAGVLVAASPDTCVVDVPDARGLVVHALGPEPGPVETAVARPGGSA